MECPVECFEVRQNRVRAVEGPGLRAAGREHEVAATPKLPMPSPNNCFPHDNIV